MKNVELYGRVGPSLGFKTSLLGLHPGAVIDISSEIPLYENQSAGSIIGKFEEYDYDMDVSRTFALVSGAGDGNNSLFVLESNGTLKTTSVFDHESNASSYSIRVETTDDYGDTTEGNFTIRLIDLLDPSIIVRGQAPADGNFSLKLDVREETEFLIRTLAHSLSQPNKLQYCTLEVRNGLGTKIAEDSGWAYNDDDKDRIQSLGFAPDADDDPALIVTLSEGNYTVSVVDVISVGGVGQIEIYPLAASTGISGLSGVERVSYNAGDLPEYLLYDHAHAHHFLTNFDFTQKVWENSPVGSFVGMADVIAAGDLDANSTVYTFIDGENNNSLFTLETNGTIRKSVVFDYETDASNYELHIRGTDENGKIATGVFIVELMDDGGDNESFLVRGFAPADGNFSLKLDVREETEFLIRTLAESLSHPSKLSSCSLEVRNGLGAKIAEDYGWAYNDDKDRIQSLGLAPDSDDDPALIITLSEGNYTVSVFEQYYLVE